MKYKKKENILVLLMDTTVKMKQKLNKILENILLDLLIFIALIYLYVKKYFDKSDGKLLKYHE